MVLLLYWGLEGLLSDKTPSAAGDYRVKAQKMGICKKAQWEVFPLAAPTCHRHVGCQTPLR